MRGPWTLFRAYAPTPEEADGFGCGMFVAGVLIGLVIASL